jgi:hypothetical protein
VQHCLGFAILNSLWMVSIMGDQSAHGKCILYEIQYVNCEALFGICNGDCVLDYLFNTELGKNRMV